VKEFDRTERIGAELQRDLAGILREEVKDPRLGLITVQEVRVSRDLAHAKVFFTCFPVDEGGREQERLLNGRLAGFLRHELAHRTRMRSIPELHFVHDESVRQGEHLAHLIDEAVADGQIDAD
jgi:ribosome-binding factor A